MRKIVSTVTVIAVLVLARSWIDTLSAQQQDGAALTPPPAYMPPPKGAPPVVDTPAQREALTKWKAKAEERTEADRKTYNLEVTPTYNFHYGKKNPYLPGNIEVQGEVFLHPGAFPTAEYCGTCQPGGV
jgi:hypothetical protein